MHKEKPASFVTQKKCLEIWEQYRNSVEVKAKCCQKNKRVKFADVYDHCKKQLNDLGINTAKAFERAVKSAQKREERLALSTKSSKRDK